MNNLVPAFIVIAIVIVIVFTELIKRLDRNGCLKGYRVWIPAILSLGVSALLRFGKFFEPQQVWFWWAVIFAFSTFAYEAILKKITTALGSDKEVSF